MRCTNLKATDNLSQHHKAKRQHEMNKMNIKSLPNDIILGMSRMEAFAKIE